MADPTVYDDSPIWDIDRRTHSFKRLVKAVDQLQSDLGGRDQLTFTQQTLAEQLALQREWLNQQWQKWLQGEKVDIEVIVKVTNSVRQLATSLGLERKSKEIASLNDILQEDSG